MLFLHNEEIKINENISNLNKIDIKKEEKSFPSLKEESKDVENFFFTNCIIINEISESFFLSDEVQSFITFNGNVIEQYNYIKMDFSEFNYIFISPEPLIQLFKPMYSNILKNALIFFPKDFGEAEKLLNDYENIILNKKKCILISPCDTLERNIKTFQDNKNILYLIGYCLDFNREHDMNNILLHFSKFYIIANSSEELVEQIFKLNTIFNYRKKQNYEIKNNINDFFELNDDNSMFLFDFNNDCSKNNTIVGKLYDNDGNIINGVAFTVKNGVLTIKYPLSYLTLYALWTEKPNAPVTIVIWKQKITSVFISKAIKSLPPASTSSSLSSIIIFISLKFMG